MQYMVGITVMSKQERASLLAQIECFASLKEMLGESMHRLTGKTTALLRSAGERIGLPLGESNVPNVNPDYSQLASKLEATTRRLAAMTDRTIEIRLRLALADLGKVPPKSSDAQVAEAILRRAAKAMKLDQPPVHDSGQLEQMVFEKCVDEQIDRLQQRLYRLSPTEQAQMRNLLRDELNRMGKGDQEALRAAIGVEKLSADALMMFLKTTSSVAITQLIIGGLGFGAFLFVTTFLKAFSLMLGMTFSFGTYMAATSTLVFILSLPFLLVAGLASGGLIANQLQNMLGNEVAKMVILAGRTKVLNNEVDR